MVLGLGRFASQRTLVKSRDVFGDHNLGVRWQLGARGQGSCSAQGGPHSTELSHVNRAVAEEPCHPLDFSRTAWAHNINKEKEG